MKCVCGGPMRIWNAEWYRCNTCGGYATKTMLDQGIVRGGGYGSKPLIVVQGPPPFKIKPSVSKRESISISITGEWNPSPELLAATEEAGKRLNEQLLRDEKQKLLLLEQMAAKRKAFIDQAKQIKALKTAAKELKKAQQPKPFRRIIVDD